MAAINLGDLSSLSTEIEVQTAGKLSMNSSIIGAVVLVISLLFFNLYLKHVFQIKHINPPHVGLSDTDASNLWEKVKEKVTGDNRSGMSDKEFLEKFQEIINRPSSEQTKS
jgi:hypothetical protein